MYGFKDAFLAVQEELKTLTDPSNWDGNEDKIFKNVIIGQAENIGLYNGPLASLLFGFTPKTGAIGMGGRGRLATIEGAVITFVPGMNEEAVLRCVHYCDVIGDWLESPTSPTLKDEGITIKKIGTDTHNWRTMNVSRDSKKPKMSTVGSTKFILTKKRV